MRTLPPLVALLAVTLAAAPSRADDDDDEVIATDTGTSRASLVIGPAIADVLQAAYHTAGLDRSPARSWVRRSRLAGLMPWLTVRSGRDTSWEDDGASGVGRSSVVEVRATWRLDRLVFDGHELQVATIEAARRRERRRLASRVIRAYFTWRRAATVASSLPARGEEAIAELDALTDGWFSANLTHLR
jgi:hypothetical protein